MVRRILETLYGTGPDGLSGNEDCGQMSAWFVMSALGLYAVAPGSTQYVIGSPLFDRATIRLENGRTFVIRARGTSRDAKYVQRAQLDGSGYDKSFIDHDAIARGGELTFDMGAEPNVAWGSSLASRPRSSIDEVPVVPAPFIASGTPVFRGTQQVTLGDADPQAEIQYWVTGRGVGPAGAVGRGFSPAGEATLKGRPTAIAISDSVTLRAIAVRNGISSPEISVTFRHLPDYPRIALSTTYAPQYAAGGADALIDGIRGGDNFRVGTWQGYLGRDLDVTLDFGAPRDIHQVSMGFLQDTGPWIFMPRRIIVQVSDDGQAFRTIGEVANTVSEREAQAVTRDFTLEASARARFVRIHVEHYGKLPPWHPGSGNDAWFFADEVVVK